MPGRPRTAAEVEALVVEWRGKGGMETKPETTGGVERRQRLGGLLNYYYCKAA